MKKPIFFVFLLIQSLFALPAPGYYSQCGQDKFVHEAFFRGKTNGVFVDVGAHNGIMYSNTKIFEEMGWKGICIEPIPQVFEELKKNRSAICIQGCIADRTGPAKFLMVSGYPEMLSGLIDNYHPAHFERVHREIIQHGGTAKLIDVNCYLLNEILTENQIFHIDYLSIDTEGGELNILKSIDYEKFDIDIIDVENNFQDNEAAIFLATKGYRLIKKVDQDDIFKKIATSNVDIISDFAITSIPINYGNIVKSGVEVRECALLPYEQALRSNNPPVANKILLWNYVLDPKLALFKLPKEKLVYFHWEPWEGLSSYFPLFSRVYTWNDDLVDGVKFFKFYYPSLMPMLTQIPSFKEKKFCTMVSYHYTDPRQEMIRFFEGKAMGDFEFYGYTQHSSRLYRGQIPGFHSGPEKLSILKNYRFCICFENKFHFNGYITEKIFGCFAAGCVPVYWGAPNVELYIPKECYIDYRDFSSNEELYQYLKAMPEDIYNQYIDNIRTFLKSEKAQVFSLAHFEKVLYEAVYRS